MLAGDSNSYQTLLELYVAILDRAAATEGLSFWSKILDDTNGDLHYVATEMWNFPGAQEDYPPELSTEDIVREVYSNILGREPQQSGLNFWVNEWNEFGPADTMLTIIENLKTNSSTDPQYLADKALFENKVNFGYWFATEFSHQEPDLAKNASELITSDVNSIDTAIEYSMNSIIGQPSLDLYTDLYA